MNGSTTKACFCRDRNSGKPLGKKCPKLTQRAHGVWSIRQELPADEEGNRRLFRRAGYETKDKAQGDLDKVRALLNITDKHDTEGRRRIGDLLVTIMASKEEIPNYDETKRKFATGQSLTQHTTVGEWLELWLAGKKALRKSGKDRYEVDIRCHLLPRIGNIRLDRLTVPHLDAMFEGIAETNVEIIDANLLRRTALDELKRIPWKGQENRARRKAMKETIEAMPPFRRITGPATQQHIKATLRAALNAAIARGIITFNPASYVELAAAKRPKALVWTDERVEAWLRTGEKPSPVMVWTPEQAGAYLDYMASDRLYGLFHVITFRGLRRGEACGVRDEDYVHLSKSLTIAVQLVQDGWDVVESAPKTDSGERVVTVDEYTDEVLLATRAQHKAERAEWGEAWQETGRFFTMPDGSWIHPGWLSDYFERTVEAAGLPPIRLHDLRHVAASLMLAAGIDVKIVSETLGHSDSRITRDIYQSVMPKVAAEAAEATAAMVPRGTSRRPAPEPDPEPTEVAVPDAVEELVPTDGQAMGKHEGAKIIAFRPRKVPA
ncbi:tyrosine-type recombinase/integrase [Streptomyces evansiae]|uniref:tyrosine-type recombinase/integrase n=1 Tax=Streptomyces evansiae TaxID=3075535 RepID=UPI002883FE9C|nr:tyrosine-type recombinase/integrase [Streptomyces sp. DSM 41859]MDT0423495.1 tyrosine-type recombinase/integrase [Streptomyces sp. DSM 41859]